MSRYKVKGKEDRYGIVVGWDKPVNTFFGVVRDTTIRHEEKQILLWIGLCPNQIASVEDLQLNMEDYVEIPKNVLQSLYSDCHS